MVGGGGVEDGTEAIVERVRLEAVQANTFTMPSGLGVTVAVALDRFKADAAVLPGVLALAFHQQHELVSPGLGFGQ